jgi:hypothetical protein
MKYMAFNDFALTFTLKPLGRKIKIKSTEPESSLQQ